MADIVIYKPSSSKSLVVDIIKKLAVDCSLVVVPATVYKTFKGMMMHLDMQAGLFLEKQISKRETITSFSHIAGFFKQCPDIVARNCYNFCTRVHYLEDSNQKIKFMYSVVSYIQQDREKAMKEFSKMEEALVGRYFGEFTEYQPR